MINHNATSIIANNHMARFMVDQARKSPRKLVDESLLIWNYAPTFTGDVCSFEQCYMF